MRSWGFEMGIVSTVLGFSGFGVGVSAGLVIGYYLFIFFQPTDVKVIIFISVYLCLCMYMMLWFACIVLGICWCGL